MISHHLAYMPESDKDVVINWFSQSKKWRELLPLDNRVQMVVVRGQHYYVYEPVQLFDFKIVVPCFFYKDVEGVKAKCLTVTMGWSHSDNALVMTLPEEVPFESAGFSTVDVSLFKTVYSEIFLDSGLKLMNLSPKVLWRECFT